MDSPSLQVFRECLEMAFSALGWVTRWGLSQIGLHGLGGFFQPKYSLDYLVGRLHPASPKESQGGGEQVPVEGLGWEKGEHRWGLVWLQCGRLGFGAIQMPDVWNCKN